MVDNVLSVASVLTNPELSFVLHMLQQKGNTDLLSAPKVTTQSGVDATIKVVTEYLYPVNYTVEFPDVNAGALTTSSFASTVAAIQPTEFEKREVGIILQVKPEVSAEGGQLINLTMSPEVVTDPTWKDYGFDYESGNGLLHAPMLMPFFHSRSITTTISIYNGATVVMGGMITEARTETDDKVPFFGDIPVIGHLFRSKSDSSEKRNLLIFVTARLVDPYGRAIGRQQAMATTIAGAQQ
jgi:general secretion pathway protein D